MVKNISRRTGVLLLFLLGTLPIAVVGRVAVSQKPAAREFFVAPTGDSSGTGKRKRPWDLQTALSQPQSVQPGDTIWLRAGDYQGSFISYLVGSPTAPIIVRAYPGERVTIDSRTVTDTVGQAALRIEGSDTWFWGLEITDTRTDRTSRRPTGANIYGPRTKLINCILHDGGDEITWKVEAVDAEIYGCLIYNNGWIEPGGVDGGFTGHGVYFQNSTGTKRLVNSIFFGSYGFGIHAYSTAIPMQGFYLEGNTVVGIGFLVGGQQPLDNVSLIENFTFGNGIALGYGNYNGSATVRGNYVYGGIGLSFDRWTQLTVIDNTVINQKTGQGACLTLIDPPGSPSYSFDRNTYYRGEGSDEMWYRYQNGSYLPYFFSGWRAFGFDLNGSFVSNPDLNLPTKPTVNAVFVRPNQYEASSANIVVYNWKLKKKVIVDLTNVLQNGAAYEIRNAQDYFGPPVLTATFDGKPVSLPMINLSVATPIGKAPSSESGRSEFGVFVVVPR